MASAFPRFIHVRLPSSSPRHGTPRPTDSHRKSARARYVLQTIDERDRGTRRLHHWLLPWLVAVAFFMQELDTAILNTAMPAIARAMQVRPLDVKSVLASYTLSLAVFIPVSGWLADRFGTRRVFAAAIGLFTLGSILCGLSTDIDMLVACRILQGAGGAMMVPVGRLTLARTFDKPDFVKVMAFVAGASLIGPMIGLVAGGLIVVYVDWRGVFFVNVPAAGGSGGNGRHSKVGPVAERRSAGGRATR